VTATAPAGEGTGVAAPAAAAAQPDTLTSHLKAEVSDLTAKLLAASVQVEGLKAQAAQVAPMTEALRAAIGEKLVALGGSADITASYTHDNIVEQFNRIDGVFKQQFRPGGVAAVQKPEEKSGTKATVSPLFTAAVESSIVK
jgi:hypothetical protein